MTTGPIYRFRGHVAPEKGIRASILSADVTDGVASLRLYDPIDSYGGDWGVSAKEFVTALDALPEDTATIRLHINSPGGEVYEGVTMLNALRNHKARVVAVVDGLAASAASFLATGADEVVMGQNSQLMIHDAWGIGMGPSATMRDLADRLDKVSDNIASIYAAKSGGNVEDWRAAMLAETWYSAEEAVAAGLADRVEEPAEPVKARAQFDLSAFQFAGREEAPPPAPVAGMSQRQQARHRAAARRHNLAG
jgi:ATP-dependent Clp endopeptidase proteolytic subunit ClpP